MGVSGCGKSHVAKMLAEHIQATFVEGDDFHPQQNIDKMRQGIGLQDEDRWPWLDAIKNHISDHKQTSFVLAASLLKESHRVASGVRTYADRLYFLDGPKDLIRKRLEMREQSGQHFMPASLIDSQYASLEKPDYALRLSADNTPEHILKSIVQDLQKQGLCP